MYHCVNYGQRVQNSVFECVADAATMAKIKSELAKLIDPEKDSLRFYYLGNNYSSKIEHIGAKKHMMPKASWRCRQYVLCCGANWRRP